MQQETPHRSNARRPDFIPFEPIRRHLLAAYPDLHEVHGSDVGTKGGASPREMICGLLWPDTPWTGARCGPARRLYALLEQQFITFDFADRIVCQVIGGPELWLTDPELREIYESVNLVAVDIMYPTCEAAAHAAVELVVKTLAEAGSKAKVSKQLGVNPERVTRILAQYEPAAA